MATQALDVTAAHAAFRKAVLRSRAVVQLTTAIKNDIQTLPKESDMAKRSVKVLDYMRGYIAAVAQEELDARAEYEEAVYQAKRRERMAERRAARKTAE